MKAAFAGSFATRMMEPVRARLSIACDLVGDDETGIPRHLPDTDVLVAMGFSAAMAEAAPNLRLVQVPGAGLDRIDRSALRPGVWLANAYGHETGIAEYIIGAMIALTRSFARLDMSLRRGHWDSQWAIGTNVPAPWPELSGKTLGILGFGRIGRALARRAAAFDMWIRAIRRSAPTERPHAVDFVGGPDRIDEVLETADYLALTLSLSPETSGLMTAARLNAMKPGAFVINVARAEIFDEAALYQALASRRLGGAALDVWYSYPTAPGPVAPASLPFGELDNVIMTPHVSGWTEGMLDARARIIAENIARTARGEEPINAVTVGA
jgi:phosphoglycerate dehydrogenase-like enzyme